MGREQNSFPFFFINKLDKTRVLFLLLLYLYVSSSVIINKNRRTKNMYKILMLEDDQYLLFQYEDSLKDLGFIVDAETDIRTFYNKSINSDYNAIVCDMALPTDNFIDNLESMGGWRTGLALCKKIRSNGSDAKLIALTNSDLAEAAEWFSQDESVAYFTKRSFPPLEFSIALKYILDNPDYNFHEFTENDTLQHYLNEARNNIPNAQNELIERLDKIIESLNSNNSKSFKASVANFISLAANISGIASSIPIAKELFSFLQTLI